MELTLIAVWMWYAGAQYSAARRWKLQRKDTPAPLVGVSHVGGRLGHQPALGPHPQKSAPAWGDRCAAQGVLFE